LLRVLHWRVLARAALTIPVFLTLLIASQTHRKVRKWMRSHSVPDATVMPNPQAICE